LRNSSKTSKKKIKSCDSPPITNSKLKENTINKRNGKRMNERNQFDPFLLDVKWFVPQKLFALLSS